MSGKNDPEHGARHETGEKMPKGADASDSSGERHERVKNGVGMGKADGLGMRPASDMGKIDGRVGEFNTGRRESVAYVHKRK